MSDKKFKDIKKQLNGISPSFCAAKWYNATVWLGNGRTASCHHPLAHSIPPREIFSDQTALHNTVFKKQQREAMLKGNRPDECGYCWRIEDNNDENIHSDRIYKSAIYTPEEIEALAHLKWDKNVDPKTLEISFDNLCNLSCSYCNPEFSSTWANDIKVNGIYENMKTEGGQAYQNDGSHAYSFGIKNEKNFYIESFFKWFDETLKDNLQELRVTGGEPTRSPYFWKLVDKCDNVPFRFAVNSNLMMDKSRMNDLIECSKRFNQFDLYTSCESHGAHAEIIRHGFNYKGWFRNLKKFTESAEYRRINIMMTISALVLFSVTDFMDDIIDLRRELQKPGLFNMSINILRFPSFQSVNVLPVKLKLKFADQFEEWLSTRREFMDTSEVNQFERLIVYLRKVEKSYEDKDTIDKKTVDFVNFFRAYSQRRNVDIEQQMNNTDFTDWWNSIQ